MVVAEVEASLGPQEQLEVSLEQLQAAAERRGLLAATPLALENMLLALTACDSTGPPDAL